MASDYRGPAPSTSPQMYSLNSTKKTYADAITGRSKKEQAVIIDSIDSYTNDDYIDGLEKLIQPTDIRFMSKISGGRVCVFLLQKTYRESNLANLRKFISNRIRVID